MLRVYLARKKEADQTWHSDPCWRVYAEPRRQRIAQSIQQAWDLIWQLLRLSKLYILDLGIIWVTNNFHTCSATAVYTPGTSAWPHPIPQATIPTWFIWWTPLLQLWEGVGASLVPHWCQGGACVQLLILRVSTWTNRLGSSLFGQTRGPPPSPRQASLPKMIVSGLYYYIFLPLIPKSKAIANSPPKKIEMQIAQPSSPPAQTKDWSRRNLEFVLQNNIKDKEL